MSPHDKCPLCRKAPKFYTEDFVLNQKKKFSAYCNCNESRIEVTYATLGTMVGDPKEYFYDIVWQKWKEEVCKERMKNPDSEETGAIDSDAVWEAVLDAMLDARLPLMRQLGAEPETYDTDFRNFCERVLKKRLSDLPGSDPDHH